MVMEQLGYTNTESNLDAIFAALADPTRRAILSRLASGEAAVNEIHQNSLNHPAPSHAD